MLQKTAIIEIRKRLGIPEGGFPREKDALVWYRKHYYQAKGVDYKGTFGLQYDYWSGLINFEYEVGHNYLKIKVPSPLDIAVPLDKEAGIIAQESNVPDWVAPVFRLVILVGEPPADIEVQIPDHLIAPLGSLRILVHPEKKLSLRKWRKTGEMMGLLPGEIDLWNVPGISTTYSPKRANNMEPLYWQVQRAYWDAIGRRRMRGQKGKRGLLKETAKILVDDYGWDYEEESYTIRRFLDRAEKIWHISTR